VEQIWAEVIVAEFASVADGKLTLVGAGFDWFNHTGPVSFGVGALLHVPWTETNTPHTWRFRLADADGGVYAGPDGGALEFADRFEVGRPPGTPAGAALTMALAFNLQGLVFPPQSRYVAQLFLDERSTPLAEAGFSVLGG
jgi:hypothetical protein